jgi:hypothetical protein
MSALPRPTRHAGASNPLSLRDCALSDIFLVYSRGGFWEDEDTSDNTRDLLRNGWDEVNAEQLIAKIRYRFQGDFPINWGLSRVFQRIRWAATRKIG